LSRFEARKTDGVACPDTSGNSKNIKQDESN